MKNDQKALLCANLIKEVYDPNSYIVKGKWEGFTNLEGDSASCLYIIKEGEVTCSQKGEVIRTLVKGDYFGEKSILWDMKRSMDVIAKTVSICYSISIETLKTILGENYKDLLFLNFVKMAFKTSSLFGKLNKVVIEKVFPIFKPKNYNKNEVVLKKGEKVNEKIVIVIEGGLINVKYRI